MLYSHFFHDLLDILHILKFQKVVDSTIYFLLGQHPLGIMPELSHQLILCHGRFRADSTVRIVSFRIELFPSRFYLELGRYNQATLNRLDRVYIAYGNYRTRTYPVPR
jgi:hypothetical protein